MNLDIRTAIDGQNRSPFALVILLTCASIMLIEGYDVQVVAYAAPAIIRAWGIDKAAFGPVFGASLFGYMLGATLLSGASDRFGRRRVIAASNLIFAAFTLASAYATGINSLLVLRFLAGLGLGCSIPATIALAVEYAPEARRAFRVSLLFVGYTLGAAGGGGVAAWLMVRFSWHAAFLLGGTLSLLAAAASLLLLPESVRFLASQGAAKGAGRGADQSEIARVLRRLRPDLPITPATRFTLPEEKAATGLPVRHLFTEGRATTTILLWAAFVTSLTSHYFLTSWIPTVLDAAGVPLAHAVVAGSLIQAGGGVGSLAVGRMADRLGMVAIAAAMFVAVPLIVLIGAHEWPEAALMGLAFVVGIALLGGQVGLNGLASTLYPTAIRSSGTGWALGIGRFGSIMGPVIGGWLIGAGLSVPSLFLCAAVPAAVSGVLILLLARRTGQGVETTAGHPRPVAQA